MLHVGCRRPELEYGGVCAFFMSIPFCWKLKNNINLFNNLKQKGMKKLLLLTKTLLVAAGLCVGASSAWGFTSKTWDFTLLNGKSITPTFTNTTTCYAETHSYTFKILDNIEGVDGFAALDGVFAVRDAANNFDIHNNSGYGIYTTGSRYWAILNLTPGSKVSFTYKTGDQNDAKLTYYTRTSNGSASIGTQALVCEQTNIPTDEVVTITSGTYLVVKPSGNARVTSMTVYIPENQAEVDAAIAATGNNTYSINSAPKGGDEVVKVYGIKATFGGSSEETWTHALGDDSRGWINIGAATTSGNLPTGRTFLKFDPIINGKLSLSAYLFTSATTYHAYLTDGTNVVEDISFPKNGNEGSLGGNGTYPINFTSELQAGKTYYVYFSKQSSSGVESYASGFWGFTFVPTNEIIGALDKTTASSDNVFGSDILLKKGEAKKITFKNHGSDFGKNWMLKYSYAGAEVTTIRADWYWKYEGDDPAIVAKRVGAYTDAYTHKEDGNVWTHWPSDMANSTVELTVSNVDGIFSVNGTMVGATDEYYFKYAYNNSFDGDITLNLSVNLSWLELLSVEQTAVPATISDAKYASFSSTYDLDFSSVEGLTAFIATGSEDNNVTLEEVDDAKAGTGLVLKGDEGTYSIPVIASGTDHSATNKLWAITSDGTVGAASNANYTNYVLALQEGKVVFAPVTGTNTAPVKAGQAALCLQTAGTGTRALSISFDDEATGINTVESNTSIENDAIYNLRGQRVSQPTKGLYIVGGKKVMVK